MMSPRTIAFYLNDQLLTRPSLAGLAWLSWDIAASVFEEHTGLLSISGGIEADSPERTIASWAEVQPLRSGDTLGILLETDTQASQPQRLITFAEQEALRKHANSDEFRAELEAARLLPKTRFRSGSILTITANRTSVRQLVTTDLQSTAIVSASWSSSDQKDRWRVYSRLSPKIEGVDNASHSEWTSLSTPISIQIEET